MKRTTAVAVGAVAACTAVAAFAGVALAGNSKTAKRTAYTGAPYLVRMHAGTEIKQFLTVGDPVPKVGGGTYRMSGLADGLGAYDNGDGTFTVLVNHEITADKGTEGHQMLDNIGIDQSGKRIMMQEDTGLQRNRGKIWMYNIGAGISRNIVEYNDDLFNPEKPGFITADEETSGAISVSDILGRGWWLVAIQNHFPTAPAGFTAPVAGFPYTDPELVEGGALAAIYIPEPR